MSTLLLTLNTGPEAALHTQGELSWALVPNLHEGVTISSYGQATLSLLPRADETVLIVPAHVLAWHRVRIPPLPKGTGAPKLRSLLEGAMEDVLLDEPSGLHLVPWRESMQDGLLWVCAVDKANLLASLRELEKAGHKVTAIAPQMLPQQRENFRRAHAYHAPGQDEHSVWLAFSDMRGVVSLPLTAMPTMRATLGLREDTYITAEPTLTSMTEHALGAVVRDGSNSSFATASITVQKAADHVLMSAQLAREAGVNLAHGELAPAMGGKGVQGIVRGLQSFALAPTWRPARVGLVLVLLANLIGLNAWAWREKSQLAEKKALMSALLTQTFPNVKVVVDPALQMQRELNTLRQSSGALQGRDAESLLGRFQAAAPNADAPAAIEFTANELSLRGVDAMREALRGAQLDSRMVGDRLVITDASSAPPAVLSSSAGNTAGAAQP
jgi:general secretion pathway protein L